MSKARRLTAVFVSFVAAVAKLGDNALASCADAIRSAIGEAVAGTERAFGGRTFVNRPVAIGGLSSALEAALPRDYASDVRELVSAIGDETHKRGRLWEVQCLADALEDHLIKPLEAAGAGAGAAVAAPPAKVAGKKKAA